MRPARLSRLTPVVMSGAVLGALLIAAGPRYVLARRPDGTNIGPALQVWPLLAVLAALPVALAMVLLVAMRGRRPALALMLSFGAAAVGRVLLDVQLVLDPARAARVELVAPIGLGALHPGPGLLLGLLGQAFTAVAGLAAAREFSPLRPYRGPRPRAVPRQGGEPEPARTPASVALVGMGCAVLAGYGMLAAPFSSTDPYLVPRSVLDAPTLAAVGQFLLAASVLLAVLLAGSAPEPPVALGGLLGAALAVFGVVVPRVVVATAVPALQVSGGSILALLGAFGLVLLAIWVGVRGRRRRVEHGAVRRPPVPHPLLARRWRLVSGSLAVLTAACVIAGVATDQLRLAPDLPRPEPASVPLPVLTAVIVAGLGVASLFRPALRSTLAVVLVAVPMAVSEPLRELLAVFSLDGVGPGPGFWLLVLTLPLTLATVVAALVSGGFERTEVDLSTARFDGPTTPAASAASVLTLPAFWLPLSDGTMWGSTGVVQPPFGLPGWALLAAFGATFGAVLIGPRCRAGQAAALFGGVAVVLVLRLLRAVPGVGLTGPLAEYGASAGMTSGWGEGAVATALCLLVVLAAMVMALREPAQLRSVSPSAARRRAS
ncbi:hypothetical protein [Pseudonocardia spinosispora]|uniref:hypothetical protein n=1 Tax=Pseudonocardia spinosispora TaxID=103441 RepID=UPI0003F62216|nr:hypothetical protein [Pseudonocardia spinosispora]